MQILELRAQGFRRSRVRGFGVQEGCFLRVNGSGSRVSRPYYPTLKPLVKKLGFGVPYFNTFFLKGTLMK